MKAVILAAGKGVRMMPLTEDKPKVMIELNGKPFLEYIIEALNKVGIKEIAVIVGYKSDVIKKYFGKKLIYIEQKEQLGTGHAVLQAKKWVGKQNFVVIMGDNLYSEEDIKEIANKKDNLCYVAGFESSHPEDYGVLAKKGDKLVKIEEKPKQPKSKLVNTGLYKLTTELFGIIEALELSPRGEYELTDALNKYALLGKVKVYKIKDYWIDMSNKAQLPQIEKKIKQIKT